MRKESFQAAYQTIADYFQNTNIQAFTTFDLLNIFEKNRDIWKIASYRNAKHFFKYLENSGILKLKILTHQSTGSVKTILSKSNASYYDIALTIKKDGYLSNYTAMSIHQLTLQIPKSIYVSFMKSGTLKNNSSTVTLSQDSIDQAFAKPQRITSEVYKSEIDNYRIVFVQKGYLEKEIGLESNQGITYTDLERTLIDIVLRPAYSGGVFEILEAYVNAREVADTDKLYNYLNQLNYAYPYHQLIGFYLEKAKYEEKRYLKFYKKVGDFKFYLTYNISNKQYDEKWKYIFLKVFNSAN